MGVVSGPSVKKGECETLMADQFPGRLLSASSWPLQASCVYHPQPGAQHPLVQLCSLTLSQALALGPWPTAWHCVPVGAWGPMH